MLQQARAPCKGALRELYCLQLFRIRCCLPEPRDGFMLSVAPIPFLHPARRPVEEHPKDTSVLAHIERLVAEEHRLFGQKSLDPQGSKRLADVQVELDQCWDLLRQRRALRETGGDPSQAHARPADVVKKYLG